VGSGTGRLLVVGLSNRDGNRSVTSVTFGPYALTRLGFQNGPGNANRVELWSVTIPDVDPPRTDTISATFSTAARAVGGAVSFTNTASTPPGGFLSASDNTNRAELLGVLGLPGQLWLGAVAANGDADSATPDPGQTEHWNAQTGTAGGEIIGAGSSQAADLLPSTTGWGLGASKPWALGRITVSPAC
jgi:hypothetical protein